MDKLDMKKCSVQPIKSRLMLYRDMETEIDNQIERIDILAIRMRSLQSPIMSDMPKAPHSTGDRLASFVAQKDELERKIHSLIEHQAEERKWVNSVLEKLESPNERAVIQLRYLEVCSWDEVARALFGRNEDYLDRKDSYVRRTTMIHGRALVNMALVLSGGS